MALWGEKKQVKLLLEHGANINARDDEGRTPLHKVIKEIESEDWLKEERIENVKLLLEKGAKFTRSDFEKFAEKHTEKDALYWLLRDASFR